MFPKFESHNHKYISQPSTNATFKEMLPYFNIPNTTNTYVFVLFTGVEGRSPEYEEPRDLRSNPFQGGGNDAILPRKGIG